MTFIQYNPTFKSFQSQLMYIMDVYSLVQNKCRMILVIFYDLMREERFKQFLYLSGNKILYRQVEKMKDRAKNLIQITLYPGIINTKSLVEDSGNIFDKEFFEVSLLLWAQLKKERYAILLVLLSSAAL